MSYNLAGLSTYTNQQTLPLITKSLFNARTISLINKQVGVKYVSALNLLDTTTTFAYGNTCGFDGSGNTTDFTQRNLTAVHTKVHEAMCPKSLEAYWMQTQLTAGSMPTTIPFEQVYAEQKVASIQKALETAVWTGTGASSSITGFAKIFLDAATANPSTDCIDLNDTAYGWASDLTFATLQSTPANAIKLLNTFETYLPADIKGYDDVAIFCGVDVFTAIKQGLVAQNYFNISYLNGVENYELTLPGSNIKLYGVNGLNGTYDLYAGRTSHFVFGTDLLNEEERFEIFYAKEADQVRFVCEFKAGVQIAFPDQTRRFMMAAS
jgi:hypothetical protein